MFNLSGLFSMLAAIVCAAVGLLAIVLKLIGVLLLGWPLVLLPLGAAAVFLFLAANGVG